MVEAQLNTATSTDPKPKYDVQKIVDYMKSKLAAGKIKGYSDEHLFKVASREDVVDYMPGWFARSGLGASMPTTEEFGSLFSSWKITAFDEKKNQNASGAAQFSDNPNVQKSESASTSANGISSSDLNQPLSLEEEFGGSPSAASSVAEQEQFYDNDIIPQPDSDELADMLGQRDPGTDPLAEQRTFVRNYNKPITIAGDAEFINQNNYLETVIDNINPNVFRSSEYDAQIALLKNLGVYGYDVEQSGDFKDQIKITRPDGQEQFFRLYTDSYKKQMLASQTEDRAEIRIQNQINDIKSWLKGEDGMLGRYEPGSSPLDNIANAFQQSNNIYQSIRTHATTYGALPPEDLSRLAAFDGMNVEDFYDETGAFNTQFANQKILEARAKIAKQVDAEKRKAERGELLRRDRGNRVRPTQLRMNERGQMEEEVPYAPDLPYPEFTPRERIVNDQQNPVDVQKNLLEADEYLRTLQASLKGRRDHASKMMGAALAISGAYESINLGDIESLKALEFVGLDVKDLPTNAIKINGNVSSVNSLMSIVMDPTGRNAIMRGDIEIDITDTPEAFGEYADYIKGVLEIVERNTARKTPTTGLYGLDYILPELEIGYELIEDFSQGAFLGGAEIISNVSTWTIDMLAATYGTDKVELEKFIYGKYAWPNTSIIPSPESVRNAKDYALPMWGTNITDADSFAELLALTNEPIAQSIPHYALYTVNPYLGLMTTGVNAYGASLNQIDMARDVAREDLLRGVELTASQKKILEVDDWEARAISTTRAGNEVLWTSMFTMPYFKGLHGARNFNGPKTVENAQKIAQAYAKTHGKSIITRLGNFLGMDAQIIMREVPEEELIAVNDYIIQTAWGIKEWDDKEFNQLWKDTGIISFMSSAGMGKIAKYGQSKNAKRMANELMLKYVNLDRVGYDYDFVLGMSPEARAADRADNNLRRQTQQEPTSYTEQDIYDAKFRADFELYILEKNDVDQESEQYLEAKQYRDGLNAEIINIRRAKQYHLDRMSPADKQVFLDEIVFIEQQEAKMNDSSLPDAHRRASQTNIEKSKNRIHDILSKTPGSLAYHFADNQTKQKFQEQAADELTAEYEANGQTNYTIKSKEISRRAEKLYSDYLIQQHKDFADRLIIAEPYGVLNPETLTNSVSDYETSEFDLNRAISDLTQQYDYGQQQVDVSYESQTYDLTDIPGSETEGFFETSTQTGPQATQQDNSLSKDIDRARQIFSDLSALNQDMDFMNHLLKNDKTKKQGELIIKFFDDLKNSEKNPNFAGVEAIIRAQKTALEMNAASPEKINIFGSVQGEGIDAMSYVNSLYSKFNAWAQKNMMFGRNFSFGTTDAFTTLALRNSNVNKPFRALLDPILKKESAITKAMGDAEIIELNTYVDAVRAYNRQNGTNHDINQNEMIPSYELYMLAGAYRQSGVLENGVDVEFARWKKLLKQEIDTRKQAYEDADNGKEKKAAKTRYDVFVDTYTRLNFENANSFDDLNGLPFNVDAIKRFAAMQSNEAALKRITDYGGDVRNKERGTATPFVDGTYIPINFVKTDGTISQQNAIGDSDAPILRTINFPESLPEGYMLNPGMFTRNMFNRMKGAEIDIQTRDDMTSLMYLIDNPTFKDMFSTKADYDLFRDFFVGKKDLYNQAINQGSDFYVDYGTKDNQQGWRETLSKVQRSFYSTATSLVLTSPFQRVQQYYSATQNVSARLNSSYATNHLRAKNRAFALGLSGASNGMESRNRISKWVQNGWFGRGDLSNIHNQSRTSLRNAIKAEFQLGDNSEIPASYYFHYLGIKSKDDLRKLYNAKGEAPFEQKWNTRMTVDGFFDFISSGAEKSLNVWLASSDRAAAVASFEALYMDYRVKQGVNLDNVDLNNWWKSENENPNTEAINYADKVISQTMRQTGALSESPIYTKKGSTQLLLQAFMPYQRFSTNAKSMWSTYYTITQDKNVPETEKQEARKAMEGIAREVFAFQGIKYAGTIAMIKGLSGLASIGMEEEDIQRSGGYTQIVGTQLNIEDRPDMSEDFLGRESRYQDFLSDTSWKNKDTKEGYDMAYVQNLNPDIDDAMYFINRFAYEYENKFEVGKTYPILASSLQRFVEDVSPINVGDIDDLIIAGVNKFFGEDLLQEFISKDLEQTVTKGGVRDFVAENFTGVYGIGEEAMSRLQDAIVLSTQNKIYTYAGEYGTQESYIGPGGPSEVRMNKLNRAVDLLLMGRIAVLTTPAIPKAEFNRYLNYLQRSIEIEFETTYGRDTNGDPLMPKDNSKEEQERIKAYKEQLDRKMNPNMPPLKMQ